MAKAEKSNKTTSSAEQSPVVEQNPIAEPDTVPCCVSVGLDMSGTAAAISKETHSDNTPQTTDESTKA